MSEWEILQLGLSTQQWQRISSSLLKHHIITQTQMGEFVLCYDLKLLTLQQLAATLGVPTTLPAEAGTRKSVPWIAQARFYLGGVDDLEGCY